MKLDVLNLLMRCSELSDFNEANLPDSKSKVRRMELYFSWRGLVFTKLFIGSKLVFLSCTKIKDRAKNRDVFNTCKGGSFMKFASSDREAMEHAGFYGSDFLSMAKFVIEDINADEPVVSGCVQVDFKSVHSAINAEAFSLVVSTLHETLREMCLKDEGDNENLFEDLTKTAQLLQSLYEAICFAENDKDRETAYKTAESLYDKWKDKSYLLLSDWGYLRDAYTDILSNYHTIITMSSEKVAT